MQLLFNLSCVNNNKNIIDYNRDTELKSIITDIYIDRKNYYLYRFKIEGVNSDLYAAYYIDSWEYASIGDSIIKNKGDDFITIKKANGDSKRFQTAVK